MDTTKKYIRHLSLCSGYEGLGLDSEEFSQMCEKSLMLKSKPSLWRTWLRRWKRVKFIQHLCSRTLKSSHSQSFVDAWTSCQEGSLANLFRSRKEEEGTEDPRHLFPYILEGIKQCRPVVVFLENVEGIISSKTADGESVLKYVLQSLEAVGYRATAGVFSASEVGAPHQRKRVFIMGYTIVDTFHYGPTGQLQQLRKCQEG